VCIPAITYHQVLPDGAPVRVRKPGEGLHSGQIHVAEFVRQMDYLANQGFSAITPDQLHRWLTSDEGLPPRPIAMDFDDHSMVSSDRTWGSSRVTSRIPTGCGTSALRTWSNRSMI